MDFNFSYKNHNGVLLNDLNIKLVESETVEHAYAFTCFKCSLFFSDLLALCEHKTNCDKNYEQFTQKESAVAMTTTLAYKYYLCDLCHSNDPLNNAVSNSNVSSSKSVISSYYLLNISDKKFYFKCFADLDAIGEHFKSEHHRYLPKSVAIETAKLPFSSVDATSPNKDGSQSVNELLPSSVLSSTLNNSNNCTTQNDSLVISNHKYTVTTTNTSVQCAEIRNLLESLASNDGHEQYACCLCTYVCYHLPSLKSHMWTHVKHEKFDYSINTSIM